ncbi:MAG TPA: sigma 54-interacting transcriptional regulator [Vicinamibacterales bacterium]|nr:sigma 54-interacting transcriptional regulator [Vicinamibacterales bacterium]
MTTEEFRNLSALAALLIPHDQAELVLWSHDHPPVRLLLRGRDADSNGQDDGSPPPEADVARLVTDEEARAYGLGSGVRAPLRVTSVTRGCLTLLAHRPRAYGDDTLAQAHALADYVSSVLRQELAVSRMSEDLLNTLADVLDIREVLPRVSEIVATALPHDRLTVGFADGQDEFVAYAASNDDGPRVGRVKIANPGEFTAAGFTLIRDLAHDVLPVTEPIDVWERFLEAGYRSLLAAHISTRVQELSVCVWSKQRNTFSIRDLPVVRRVADYVGLVLSHQQLADAARQIAEARARAERLEVRAKSLAAELDLRSGVGRAIGHSPEWTNVLKRATQVAETETTVLVQGESGTGKEVVARFIHRASPRKGGPFMGINCAALPEQLLESELFGYERGAFTGAQQSKVGQIELASNGVLFLDEITEMSLSAQAKLLRVLQEREFQRLGGTRAITANVRVIAATNRDLRIAVERGTFREDLYYRLQVFEIVIPPLRDRQSDVLPLADAFLEDIARSFGRPVAGLTADAKRALLEYNWPGNVRELRNALERAAILCEGGLIGPQHFMLPTKLNAAAAETTDLNVVERQTIGHVMRETRGNKSRAAKRLGLTRTQLYHRLRKYGLDTAGT